MKKIFVLLLTLLLAGCTDLSNTPIKKTEEFLKKYQTLDNSVITDLNKTVDEELTLSESQKDKYKDIMKKHYQNMTYEIKEDYTNGDDARVVVEIEVTDFNKVLNEAEVYLNEHLDEFNDDFGNYSLTKYNDYKLDKMKEAKDKVKYTITINLTKINDKWEVDRLNDKVLDKINGIYDYQD